VRWRNLKPWADWKNWVAPTGTAITSFGSTVKRQDHLAASAAVRERHTLVLAETFGAVTQGHVRQDESHPFGQRTGIVAAKRRDNG